MYKESGKIRFTFAKTGAILVYSSREGKNGTKKQKYIHLINIFGRRHVL